MATLNILTADEFTALDLEGRWRTRRVARELQMSRRILRMFLDRGGPIPLQDIISAAEDSAESVHQTLTALDDDDLIRIRDGRIDIAYPFSASPTPFVVRLPDGRKRYACCAMDALGIAPMIGRRIEIRSRCHHSGAPLEFPADPQGPGSEAEGIMLWIEKPPEEKCRAADAY